MSSNVLNLGGSLEFIFTQGWCPLLACAFKAIAPEMRLIETEGHVAVVDPDGCVWDIKGRRTQDEFELEWGPVKPFTPVDHEAAADLLREDWFAVAMGICDDGLFGLPNENAWRITCEIATQLLDSRELK